MESTKRDMLRIIRRKTKKRIRRRHKPKSHQLRRNKCKLKKMLKNKSERKLMRKCKRLCLTSLKLKLKNKLLKIRFSKI